MWVSVSLFTAVAVATTSSASLVLHETRPTAPSGFVSQGAAPVDQAIELRIGLVSNDIDGLHEKLVSVSTPGSPDFRQWLSSEEIKSFMQPPPETLVAFDSFARAYNLTTANVSPYGDWLSLATTVGEANTLFGTRFETYTHPAMSQPLVRTLSVSLPSELAGHVDVVHPTTSFEDPDARLTPLAAGRVGRDTTRRDVPQSCSTTITPACLQALYGIPTTPATEPSNSLLVTAYDFQYAEYLDVSQFLMKYRPDIDPSTNFTVQVVDNGRDPQDPDASGSEAELDVEYTIGLATGVPLTFLSNGNTLDILTAFVDSANFIGNLSSPPSVVTTSYGINEDTASASVATKLCNTYSALTARGISVLHSSGDGGVRGGHDQAAQCTNNTFLAVFPASCPFVTAVGATVGIAPEQAANFTGGGFSNLFALPTYQAAAVAGFKETIPSDFAGVFNQTGRGYPDVATQGVNFEIFIGGETDLTGGTSASSPTFASIIALVNDRLVAAGKPVLGFLNPWLYSSASSAFTDVTIGKNVGSTCPASAVAFTAAEGWDPLTGLGTPLFPELLTAALA